MVVHPAKCRRGHAGSAGAICSLQRLLHQGNGLEMVLLPEARQVGRVANGSVPGSDTGAADNELPGQQHLSDPTAHRSQYPLCQWVSCFTGQQDHPGCWLLHQRPRHLYSQELRACPPFTSGAEVARTGHRPQASWASIQGSIFPF